MHIANIAPLLTNRNAAFILKYNILKYDRRSVINVAIRSSNSPCWERGQWEVMATSHLGRGRDRLQAEGTAAWLSRCDYSLAVYDEYKQFMCIRQPFQFAIVRLC